MFLPIVLFLLLHTSTGLIVEPVDYVNFDYCKKSCKAGPKDYENSACDCRGNATHSELLLQLMEFRKTMLHFHNSVRNLIAGGFLKHKDGTPYPKAANMRALSYSMEVEYTARCFSLKINDYHDDCRSTSKHEHVGQNLQFTPHPYGHPYDISVWGWWREYNVYHPKYIAKFQSVPGERVEKFAHFTQLVWWSVYTVGCARSWNPENHKGWRYAMFCNYETSDYGANVVTMPVYKAGEPCSACPKGMTCNKKYIYLCGEIDPVPEDPPVHIYKRGEATTTTSKPKP